MIPVRFQGKPFNITVIQVYAPTSNTEEAEVEWFYEDLQDPPIYPCVESSLVLLEEGVCYDWYVLLAKVC